MQLGRLTDSKFQGVLRELLQQKGIPVKTAFKLKGIVKSIQAEVEKYDEFRGELIKKYASRDEAGEVIVEENGHARFSTENMTAFFKELNELLSLEVDVKTVELDELGEAVSLTVEDLMVLDGFVV